MAVHLDAVHPCDRRLGRGRAVVADEPEAARRNHDRLDELAELREERAKVGRRRLPAEAADEQLRGPEVRLS